MSEQEFRELSAGHALHALTPEDEAVFDAALADHPEWQEIVEADAATVASLAESVSPVAPPLATRGILLSAISSLPQGDDAPPPGDMGAESRADGGTAPPERAAAPADDADDAPPAEDPAPTTATIQAISRRNWSRGLFALAASLVILVVLGFGAASLNEWVNRPPEVVALQQIEDAPDGQSATVETAEGGVATAYWSDSLGTAVLVTEGLPALAGDEAFEMWLVREDGVPVSAGTFAGSDDETAVVLAGEIRSGDTIAVSIEDEGGSPTGAPTTDPILAIPTA